MQVRVCESASLRVRVCMCVCMYECVYVCVYVCWVGLSVNGHGGCWVQCN